LATDAGISENPRRKIIPVTTIEQSAGIYNMALNSPFALIKLLSIKTAYSIGNGIKSKIVKPIYKKLLPIAIKKVES
jgi:hypothetical protein